MAFSFEFEEWVSKSPTATPTPKAVSKASPAVVSFSPKARDNTASGFNFRLGPAMQLVLDGATAKPTGASTPTEPAQRKHGGLPTGGAYPLPTMRLSS